MIRSKWLAILAAVSLSLAVGGARAAGSLTILWAEWDPANYLQELVKDYEKQTGAASRSRRFRGRTSRPRPSPSSMPRATPTTWSSATRSGWAPARPAATMSISPILQEAQRRQGHGAGHRRGLCRVSDKSSKYWAVPLEGDANGWAYRKDWFEDPKEKAAFKAKYGYDLGVPKTCKRAARHRRVLPSPERKALRRRHLHRQHLRRAGDGRRERRSSATAATWATTPPTRSTASSTPRKPSRR